MVKKIKLEVELEDGTKVKVEVPHGSKDKIENFLRLLDLYSSEDDEFNVFEDTIYQRFYNLIKKEFGFSTFSLSDLYSAYLLKYGEKIKKSTLSTYLSRLVEDGVLIRYGRRGKYKYKLISVERGYFSPD